MLNNRQTLTPTGLNYSSTVTSSKKKLEPLMSPYKSAHQSSASNNNNSSSNSLLNALTHNSKASTFTSSSIYEPSNSSHPQQHPLLATGIVHQSSQTSTPFSNAVSAQLSSQLPSSSSPYSNNYFVNTATTSLPLNSLSQNPQTGTVPLTKPTSHSLTRLQKPLSSSSTTPSTNNNNNHTNSYSSLKQSSISFGNHRAYANLQMAPIAIASIKSKQNAAATAAAKFANQSPQTQPQQQQQQQISQSQSLVFLAPHQLTTRTHIGNHHPPASATSSQQSTDYTNNNNNLASSCSDRGLTRKQWNKNSKKIQEINGSNTNFFFPSPKEVPLDRLLATQPIINQDSNHLSISSSVTSPIPIVMKPNRSSNIFSKENISLDSQSTTTTTTATAQPIIPISHPQEQLKQQQKQTPIEVTQQIPSFLKSSQFPVSQHQQSDEVKLVRKTQHIVKGLTSSTGASTANDQEKLDDLEESVLLMMNDLTLLEQAQRGDVVWCDPVKCSSKGNGLVSCYAAKTHQGLVRNYNEDRVSIILNISKPPNRSNEEPWPKCSFFGVYDGHGGVNCADFLRDNLHQYVIKDSNFPSNPKEAIRIGFEQAEAYFLKSSQQLINKGLPYERSGSCAIVVLIVGDTCYVANVGDSRAVISQESGKTIYALTRDHKPMDSIENARIHLAGGKIYQTKIETILASEYSSHSNEEPSSMMGPYRVLPGRLSVTRTFGDIEAKLSKLGGNPRVVIATPDIKSFKILPSHDFIVIGCDGVFDKVRSQELGQIAWDTHSNKSEQSGAGVQHTAHSSNLNNVHQFAGKAVDNMMKLCFARRTIDNVTAVLIGFDNLQRVLSCNSAASTSVIDSSGSASTSFIQTPILKATMQHHQQQNSNVSPSLAANNWIGSSSSSSCNSNSGSFSKVLSSLQPQQYSLESQKAKKSISTTQQTINAQPVSALSEKDVNSYDGLFAKSFRKHDETSNQQQQQPLKKSTTSIFQRATKPIINSESQHSADQKTPLKQHIQQQQPSQQLSQLYSSLQNSSNSSTSNNRHSQNIIVNTNSNSTPMLSSISNTLSSQSQSSSSKNSSQQQQQQALMGENKSRNPFTRII